MQCLFSKHSTLITELINELIYRSFVLYDGVIDWVTGREWRVFMGLCVRTNGICLLAAL